MKPIPQYPKYEISEDGKVVQNLITGHILKQSKTNGYPYVTLLPGDGAHYILRIPVHRLVAFAYLPAPASPDHVWINHKNGVRDDNRAENLEWTTISNNIKHSYEKLGRKPSNGMLHRRHGIVAKAKMRAAKIGENHPKFRGYYVVDGKEYASLRDASANTHLSMSTIRRHCRSGSKGFSFREL